MEREEETAEDMVTEEINPTSEEQKQHQNWEDSAELRTDQEEMFLEIPLLLKYSKGLKELSSVESAGCWKMRVTVLTFMRIIMETSHSAALGLLP